MFKIMFFLWRREGMSVEEFCSYYEDKHAHNNQKVRPASADYRRNYPLRDDPWSDTEQLARLGGFDVMTENFYPSREAFQNVLDVMIRSSAASSINEDEAQFEIRHRKKVFVVREVPTLEFGSADYEPAARRNENGRFKLVRYVERAASVSPAQFQERYESERVPALRALFAGSIDYRRNHLQFEDELTFNGPQEMPTPIDRAAFPCDVIEEFWYPDRDTASRDYTRFRAEAGSTPGAGLEGPGSAVVVVRECRMPRPQAATSVRAEQPEAAPAR